MALASGAVVGELPRRCAGMVAAAKREGIHSGHLCVHIKYMGHKVFEPVEYIHSTNASKYDMMTFCRHFSLCLSALVEYMFSAVVEHKYYTNRLGTV